MSSRPRKSRSADPTPTELTPEESRAVARMLYERGRLKGKALRDAEANRRRAQLPPRTLDEAITEHFASRGLRRADLGVDFMDDLASVESAYVGRLAPSAPNPLLKDRSDELAAELKAALSLPADEKLERYGWAIGIPFDALGSLPDELRSPDARPELPAWSLRACFDSLRDDHWSDLVRGVMDRDTLEAERRRRGLTRSVRPDEAHLTPSQRSHLRKLRVKLKTARDIYERHSAIPSRPEVVARAKSYVDAAEKAIREARVAYGLPATEGAP